mmetsp:Transcript_5456/g.9222  ORF Transcript_5456/g.9222 Transcript_5456/m.9222 type:complete len:242 (+) Transcript_5456:797-1522(+)
MANLYLMQQQEKVEQVECGSIHTVIRTNLSRLFSCGNGATYALGHGNKETCKNFKQIQFFNSSDPSAQGVRGISIKTIACGLAHSGCVLSDGSVYQWGSCGDFKSALKSAANPQELVQKSICPLPLKVSFKNCMELVQNQQSSSITQKRNSIQNDASGDQYSSPSIMDLKMGESFSIALSTRGYVYTWGLNDMGQLGIGNEVSQFDPVQIQQIGPSVRHSIKPVTKIACGLRHCLVLNKNY